MSRVKIKADLTTTAATAAVDVQVKLEPSLSAADIKLENDTDDEDTNQSQDTITPKKKRQFICERPECGRSFNSAVHLGKHQHEHKLQTEFKIYSKKFTLIRKSLSDRWQCPAPDCTSTLKTVDSLRGHIQIYHGSNMKQPQQQQQQQQQSPTKRTRQKYHFVDVDNFYVKDARCGYQHTNGVFICHECKLVPECLLTHLQQKHGYDEESIDNSALPDSTVAANTNPNINQHISNQYLASAISRPCLHYHQNIVQGWQCVTSDCSYSGYSTSSKSAHKKKMHQGEQFSTVPALVLRFSSSKVHTSYFLITRFDKASGAVTAGGNRVSQHVLDYSHDGLNAQDENEDGVDQNETTETFNQRRQWKCEYPNCGLTFSSSSNVSMHRREHKCDVVINVQGETFVLTRQSSDDRWACPVPDCEKMFNTINTIYYHILSAHHTTITQNRSICESDNGHKQQLIIKKTQRIIPYLKVNGFYVNSTRCGYHTTIGVFICHDCRLIPECLPTHLQQQHGYDVKSIDSSTLPDSAVNAGADPNVNQHNSNSHLAAAIREPHRQQHQDIAQGWLCTTSDCGYCCPTKRYINRHQREEHKDQEVSMIPALVLRLYYSKARGSYFLITRLDATANNIKPSSSTIQHNSECNDEHDGDELVLSDYGDEHDIN